MSESLQFVEMDGIEPPDQYVFRDAHNRYAHVVRESAFGPSTVERSHADRFVAYGPYSRKDIHLAVNPGDGVTYPGERYEVSLAVHDDRELKDPNIVALELAELIMRQASREP